MKNEREIDARVHEDVMGQTWDETRCRVCGWPVAGIAALGCLPGNCSQRPAPARRADEPPPYSTDIAAAWQVVEKMLAQHWSYAVENVEGDEQGRAHTGGKHSAWFAQYDRVNEDTKSYLVIEATAPLAICLAALSALSANPKSKV